MDKNLALNILEFWQNAGPSTWWQKNLEFDNQIKSEFGALHERAVKKDLDGWRDNANSCLALVILLDQFSRNMFRGSPKTFDQDGYALELAKFAVKNNFHTQTPSEISGFFFLPYMHSEVLADQESCVTLIKNNGNEYSLNAAIEHRDIIAKFGRFPHRNSVLGRTTTPSEQTFLDAGGFAG